ncbi:glutamate--tRNA ligase [Marinibaculum pumilum]|uniref:Glutamate--tRNA ligase n=1 Tax=Marinibaculum pumilum TaxID=1766165 RepID=A0ABV7KUD7_9PROT
MTVVTRFAPSPTGFLHIGGARTALFNWLFARHHGGRYLLRIEDTDRARSTPDAVQAILDGLDWLGLSGDEAPWYQHSRLDRHREVALRLLAEGRAYRCWATPEELAEMRERARAEGRAPRYDGRWRDRDPAEAPAGIDPAIRLKAPQEGQTVIEDLVQGRVTIDNGQLDDMVLLRADGTPTYMLAVVVDDHDMGITHVIRGDDHLTNAARQTQLYLACGFDLPAFAHIPLIHGPDGAKLSKRHGALGVDAYRDMGYLPEALRNYLLRLGWAHGDDEIISTEQAVDWFDLDAVGRSAARFDFAKLESLNGHYIRLSDDDRLVAAARPFLERQLSRSLSADELTLWQRSMPGFKERAKTVTGLAEASAFLFLPRPIPIEAAGAKLLGEDAQALLRSFRPALAALDPWTAEALEALARDFAEQAGQKLGKLAQPLRAAVTGSNASPPIFDVLVALGQSETLGRIDDVLAGQPA